MAQELIDQVSSRQASNLRKSRRRKKFALITCLLLPTLVIGSFTTVSVLLRITTVKHSPTASVTIMDVTKGLIKPHMHRGANTHHWPHMFLPFVSTKHTNETAFMNHKDVEMPILKFLNIVYNAMEQQWNITEALF